GGVLGSASAVTPDGSLSLRYDRFWRQQSPTELRLEVSPPVSGSRLRIWISREYIERVNISQIMPAPESVEISSDRVVLEFSVGDSPERVPIMLRIEPLVPWRTPGRLGIDGGGGLSFAQFIYP